MVCAHKYACFWWYFSWLKLKILKCCKVFTMVWINSKGIALYCICRSFLCLYFNVSRLNCTEMFVLRLTISNASKKTCIHNIPFTWKAFITNGKQKLPWPVYSYCSFYFGDIFLCCSSKNFWCRVPALQLAAKSRPVPGFINTVLFFMKLVVAQFILYP